MAKLPDIASAIARDEHLREYPRWPDRIAYAIRRARKQLSDARQASNDTLVLRTLGYLTDACRVAGEYEAATTYGQEALDRSRSSGNRNAQVANLVRLGLVYQYAGNPTQAEPLFRDALTFSAGGDSHALHDVVLHHFGIFLLDLERIDESISILEAALTIRQSNGNQPAIEATERALNLARARRATGTA